MTIGIPKALIYWKRPYFWQTFFKELGFKVFLSCQTNKKVVEMGVRVADPETCFSIKVFFGHLLWLDKKCDWIFIPRLKTNEQRLEYCPKFFGLPDLAKILVKTPILTETFDEKKEKFEGSVERLGAKLNKNKKEVKKAIEIAFLEEKKTKEKEEKEFFEKIQSKKQKIILISHPYNLYDDYVNLRIKEKLENLNAEVIFINQISIESQKSKVKSQKLAAGWPKFHWEFGQEIMEQIQEILKYNISGVVEISSFQCGCDAVLREFVEREFKKRKIPFLYLLIDEQAGEAGIQTRIEAFMDTIK